jgi:hypothetical protein
LRSCDRPMPVPFSLTGSKMPWVTGCIRRFSTNYIYDQKSSLSCSFTELRVYRIRKGISINVRVLANSPSSAMQFTSLLYSLWNQWCFLQSNWFTGVQFQTESQCDSCWNRIFFQQITLECWLQPTNHF